MRPNTGYSRVLGYGKPTDFIGVDQDGRAFTQFIQRYLSQFGRWNSPKFLFGEATARRATRCWSTCCRTPTSNSTASCSCRRC